MTNYKSGITVHLNTLIIEALANTSNASAYVDEVLSGYFGISYEEAYPGCSKGKWLGIAEQY